ncbi:endonuclease subunit [uncultured Caudovirales phage]|uniref:Endonuclease subunit n=1 Tax=uncultured Caudovirales phage TaxID=2100421 RepID=A0A6J5RGA4_9CAUD|nr:endonuclease subunit [uncultured Caudovirales phage]CAB4185582.1 endonuclease subunit [uncultured Caudovirales phage]CAB4193257.1 endonuclease subunit [uncultured Caudovirales phage]CAB4216168.1 endonuclease subunit [uncultured Caudovirales phage]CAB5230794.1 endonuclease subunit [uncultured Caudovirales phage]
MIIFKEIRWSNAFSYGANNIIRLDDSPLTQIVGKNGHGKSSIALIIEEVLYNQNSKKIKKADILNRYINEKAYVIELDFSKDGTEYTIKTNRTSTTAAVKLFKDDVDISSHTATATYKTIEGIIGYDHKTFSQIVYQSSVSSLEFLTATDTARKKFLIELLSLSTYTRASECFKELASDMTKRVDSIQTKVATVRSWLTKYEKEDLKVKPLLEEPEAASTIEVTMLKHELANIESTNKKIIQNNTYKNIIAGIVLDTSVPSSISNEYLTDLKIKLSAKQKSLKDGKALSAKCSGPTIKCPTCSQDMDNSTMFSMVKQFEVEKTLLELDIASLASSIIVAEEVNTKYNIYQKKLTEWEKYYTLIDTTLIEEVLDKDLLESEISTLETYITKVTKSIAQIRQSNKTTNEHNSKVSVISSQMADMRKELSQYSQDLVIYSSELSNLQILVKAFSTTGLVAYKIECLVKDLEKLTNEYLAELADGRFQLSFKIASSDKLNVVITDNSYDVDIIALSSGERARVNVATLLAIRKLMQTLSNSRTNLLILDETVENLDAEGKEKLIEVLLKEDNLNTFLISHGFSHPLLEKLQVVKQTNISRIDNG